MITQITCPNCRSRYAVEIQQIVDVGQQPELKSLLISGRLNVAVCPACGAAGQLATPMLYHDPAHELFMVFVPVELGLSQVEQERVIGQLVNQAMNSLPAEQRKGYMLRPQTVLSLNTLMEKVLETEGITPEMLARQRRQAELVQKLADAEGQAQDELIRQNLADIDETVFSIVGMSLEAANQTQQDDQAIKLLNLQAKLYTDTKAGRRLEKRQKALHDFRQAAQKAGGLKPSLLLQHIVAAADDERLVEALASMGQPALDYEFFTLLTDRIERKQKAGDKATAEKLTQVREKLLAFQTAIRQESQKVMDAFNQRVNTIMTADDKPAAVRQMLPELDDTFLYLLTTAITQSEQRKRTQEAAALRQLYDLIVEEMENQAPPEVRLFNQLLRAETPKQQQQLLQDNRHLISPDFLEMVELITAEMGESAEPELTGRIEQVKSLIRQAALT